MSWIEIACWFRTYDPRGWMSELQRMVITSALMRDDVKKAKQCLIDWKIPPP